MKTVYISHLSAEQNFTQINYFKVLYRSHKNIPFGDNICSMNNVALLQFYRNNLYKN